MKGLRVVMMAFLASSAIQVSGCMPPAQRFPAVYAQPEPQKISIPESPPPKQLHVLRLKKPTGDGLLIMSQHIKYSPRPLSNRDYNTEYIFIGSGAISMTDEVGGWAFSYARLEMKPTSGEKGEWREGLHGLGIQLTNKSSVPLEIDWNRTTLVDPSGRALQIVHGGVKMVDAGKPMGPSIVPVGARLDDFIFPHAFIVGFIPASYASWWAARPFFENLAPGEQVTATVALKAGDQPITKTFVFVIE